MYHYYRYDEGCRGWVPIPPPVMEGKKEMPEELFVSVGEAARQLGVTEIRVRYAVDREAIRWRWARTAMRRRMIEISLVAAAAYFKSDLADLDALQYRPGARLPEPEPTPAEPERLVVTRKPKEWPPLPKETECWFLVMDRKALSLSGVLYGYPSQFDLPGVVVKCKDEADATRRRSNLCAEFCALAAQGGKRAA